MDGGRGYLGSLTSDVAVCTEIDIISNSSLITKARSSALNGFTARLLESAVAIPEVCGSIVQEHIKYVARVLHYARFGNQTPSRSLLSHSASSARRTFYTGPRGAKLCSPGETAFRSAESRFPGTPHTLQPFHLLNLKTTSSTTNHMDQTTTQKQNKEKEQKGRSPLSSGRAGTINLRNIRDGVDVRTIRDGVDVRTTVMVRNIPNKMDTLKSDAGIEWMKTHHEEEKAAITQHYLAKIHKMQLHNLEHPTTRDPEPAEIQLREAYQHSQRALRAAPDNWPYGKKNTPGGEYQIVNKNPCLHSSFLARPGAAAVEIFGGLVDTAQECYCLFMRVKLGDSAIDACSQGAR
ncbi:hypothetical protein HDK90DRAFT_471025 [Phyllosticta capitalensis]|uniref:Uncharacterized protein n=1 Tax=Phyllosticta capitalensis TaxID=121624 RepID=A0ABR1Y8P1_9PEZI